MDIYARAIIHQRLIFQKDMKKKVCDIFTGKLQLSRRRTKLGNEIRARSAEVCRVARFRRMCGRRYKFCMLISITYGRTSPNSFSFDKFFENTSSSDKNRRYRGNSLLWAAVGFELFFAMPLCSCKVYLYFWHLTPLLLKGKKNSLFR